MLRDINFLQLCPAGTEKNAVIPAKAGFSFFALYPGSLIDAFPAFGRDPAIGGGGDDSLLKLMF
jgi:hypothetical protein